MEAAAVWTGAPASLTGRGASDAVCRGRSVTFMMMAPPSAPAKTRIKIFTGLMLLTPSSTLTKGMPRTFLHPALSRKAPIKP
jgi:hypothetical protein